MIEVGLGGVRDATNVLQPSSLAAAVVTAVGHDHAAALGGTIERIAAAKAGIMQASRRALRPIGANRSPLRLVVFVRLEGQRKMQLGPAALVDCVPSSLHLVLNRHVPLPAGRPTCGAGQAA